MQIESGANADIKVGNALPIMSIPVGTLIHNIELKPGKGGQLVRSAGTSAQILGREERYVLVRLASGEVRKVLGRTPIGRKSPVTPWGKPALGLKTRNKKKASSKLIVRGRNK